MEGSAAGPLMVDKLEANYDVVDDEAMVGSAARVARGTVGRGGVGWGRSRQKVDGDVGLEMGRRVWGGMFLIGIIRLHRIRRVGSNDRQSKTRVKTRRKNMCPSEI